MDGATKLEQRCYDLITSQHSTLWGRAYDLSQEQSREDAARWFASQIRGLMELGRQ
jgi:hypothetical protein